MNKKLLKPGAYMWADDKHRLASLHPLSHGAIVGSIALLRRRVYHF